MAASLLFATLHGQVPCPVRTTGQNEYFELVILAACLLVCGYQLLCSDELAWGAVGLPGNFSLTKGGAHMASLGSLV